MSAQVVVCPHRRRRTSRSVLAALESGRRAARERRPGRGRRARRARRAAGRRLVRRGAWRGSQARPRRRDRGARARGQAPPGGVPRPAAPARRDARRAPGQRGLASCRGRRGASRRRGRCRSSAGTASPPPECQLLRGLCLFRQLVPAASRRRLRLRVEPITAASSSRGFERGPVLACQFHPELSGAWGMICSAAGSRGSEMLTRPRHPVPRRQGRARGQGRALHKACATPATRPSAPCSTSGRAPTSSSCSTSRRRPRAGDARSTRCARARAALDPADRRRRRAASRTRRACSTPAPTRSRSTPPRSRTRADHRDRRPLRRQCAVLALDAARDRRRLRVVSMAGRAHRQRRRRLGARGAGAAPARSC